MIETIADTIVFLENTADILDKWAFDSRKWGWSTHQVDANLEQANRCRRVAGKLRREFAKLAAT